MKLAGMGRRGRTGNRILAGWGGCASGGRGEASCRPVEAVRVGWRPRQVERARETTKKVLVVQIRGPIEVEGGRGK